MATLANIFRFSQDEQPAVIISGKNTHIVTHFELKQHVTAFRKRLAELGVGPGSAVSICLPNSLEFVISFLATTIQRGTAAPLNPAFKQDEVGFQLDDVAAAAILVPKDGYRKDAAIVLAARQHNIAIIECYLHEANIVLDVKEKGKLGGRGGFNVEEPLEDDVALLLHTSGTTGKPKTVPLSHRNLSVSIDNICMTYELTASDRTMAIMPLFHVHGLLASFLSPLRAGSAIVIPARLAPSFWHDFETHKCTWYTATPTMHQILLSFQSPLVIPPIRFIRSCSSPLSPQLLENLESRFQTPVLEAYAMTEASHQITSNPLPPGPRVAGSVGLAQGDIELRILDPEGNNVTRGTEGEICIRAPTVMAGYLSNPTANTSAFTADGFFRTGDYGRQDRDGFLFLTGRIKEFINKGGEKISPVELDHVIAAHPTVVEAVTFAIDDEMYGQEVGAAVRLEDGSRVEVKDLKKWVRERVAAPKVPKKIWLPSEIPKTATGKVQRKMVAENMQSLA